MKHLLAFTLLPLLVACGGSGETEGHVSQDDKSDIIEDPVDLTPVDPDTAPVDPDPIDLDPVNPVTESLWGVSFSGNLSSASGDEFDLSNIIVSELGFFNGISESLGGSVWNWGGVKLHDTGLMSGYIEINHSDKCDISGVEINSDLVFSGSAFCYSGESLNFEGLMLTDPDILSGEINTYTDESFLLMSVSANKT
jgi:hypothetical protein